MHFGGLIVSLPSFETKKASSIVKNSFVFAFHYFDSQEKQKDNIFQLHLEQLEQHMQVICSLLDFLNAQLQKDVEKNPNSIIFQNKSWCLRHQSQLIAKLMDNLVSISIDLQLKQEANLLTRIEMPDANRLCDLAKHGDLRSLVKVKDKDLLLFESARYKNQRNILHYACKYGHLDVVCWIVEKFGSRCLELTDIEGWAPLHFASFKGHAEIVKYFLQKDVNVNLKNKDGWTALHQACMKGHLQIVQMLVLDEQCDINSKENTSKSSPLHWAVQEGHIEIVKLLIECGADVKIKTIGGHRPLHYASNYNQPKIAQLLICADVNHETINAKTNHGWTPLMKAVKSQNIEVIEILLQSRVDCDTKNKSNKNALDYVLETKNTKICKLFFDFFGIQIQEADTFKEFELLRQEAKKNQPEKRKRLKKNQHMGDDLEQ